MRAVLLRDVYRGEELTIAYGPKFFGNEASCVCITCEKKAENGWTTVVDGEISDEEGKLEAERLLDLRLANPKGIAVQTHVFPYATDEWRVRGLPRRWLGYIDLIPIGRISTCPDCGLLIAGLKKKKKLLCYNCLQKAAITTRISSVPHRYFSTLLELSDDDPSSPLTREGQTICSITSFLESFEAPEGWEVFPQPITSFSEVEKAGIYQSIVLCVRSEWTSMLCGEFLTRMKFREELKRHPVGWAIEDASELVQLGRERFEEAEATRNAARSQAAEGGAGGGEGSISSLSLAPPSEGTGDPGGYFNGGGRFCRRHGGAYGGSRRPRTRVFFLWILNELHGNGVA